MIPFQGKQCLEMPRAVWKWRSASYAWLCCNQLLPNSPCIVGGYGPWCFVRNSRCFWLPPSDYQCDLLYVFREAFIILYPWRNQHSLMESGNLKECLPTIVAEKLPSQPLAHPWKFTRTQQDPGSSSKHPCFLCRACSASTDPIRYS